MLKTPLRQAAEKLAAFHNQQEALIGKIVCLDPNTLAVRVQSPRQKSEKVPDDTINMSIHPDNMTVVEAMNILVNYELRRLGEENDEKLGRLHYMEPSPDPAPTHLSLGELIAMVGAPSGSPTCSPRPRGA